MQAATRIKITLANLVIAFLIIYIIFNIISTFWYPAPYMDMFKIKSKLIISLITFAIISPLLTLLLLKKEKPKKKIITDLIVVFTIQIIALLLLIYITGIARPLAIVFEVDRFRIITYFDIPEEKSLQTPEWFTPWNFKLPKHVGIREIKTLEQKMISIQEALQGIDASQNPERWIEYNKEVKNKVRIRTHALKELLDQYPESNSMIKKIISEKSINNDSTVWLPVTNRHSYSWIALLNSNNAEIIGYVPLEGFFNSTPKK